MMDIWNRIYADYLAPNRFAEYNRLIERTRENGFKHLTIQDLYKKVASNSLTDKDKIFVHRHDIDTDPAGARKFFDIEKRHGIHASYYFRLGTFDLDLMQEIYSYGSEVGYHFEELSTYVKRARLTSRSAVIKHLDVISRQFEVNFLHMEDLLGFKISTVAAHGDFINRQLGILNQTILADAILRKRLSIECEVYDDRIMSAFDSYLSDAPPKKFYAQTSPFNEITSKRRICLLTHPRHWRTNFYANTKENITRISEGILGRSIAK